SRLRRLREDGNPKHKNHYDDTLVFCASASSSVNGPSILRSSDPQKRSTVEHSRYGTWGSL
ncbi:MAG: hypothetical protein PVG57_04770, partial [Gammaproteobacteria bacterium]